ncbi:phage tail tape measure protein [Aliivibrio sifiae]|uniref:Phage tail tape measure protein n=1 Tax=Aliivibrio sifiae TaxID=566293 RepID=A0A2S7XHG4_9GAMM|nr:phage tail tape measure protein [Aliivibrio sifiae]PQJ93154.1 phage tail tape measure protein [Aliivibrio sifiae]GLR75990.1 hypothetical protein GCM10007855_28640 [Aliivibrio sifiae]
MASSLDKLMLQVAIIDQATKPLKSIGAEVTNVSDAGRAGMNQVAGGAAGLIASGLAIKSALMPAIEMDRKLGEVASLGVVGEDLNKLKNTALMFSAEYGKSATEFVNASYDIQSAFSGINGDQLSDITKSSAVLAAATKADTATITSYMGTMYGVFKNQANEMGAGIWSKQVAGMTAQSVEMFKTTGKGMSDAFTSVGANATSAGIKMNEQMAILGTLQAAMSGSEAGTKYKAFLTGVAGAQDKLNMSFTDSQGQMLPMLDILGKLKTKFGDTIDVAEGNSLKKAFGSDEAVGMIKLLMTDTNGLAKSMQTLGKVTGMDKATQMAKAQTDQWKRLEASWFAIRAAVGGLILPAINRVAGALSNGLTVLVSYSQEYPVLAEFIGYAGVALLSIAGIVSLFSMVAGIAKLATAGWTTTTIIFNGVMVLMRGGLLAMRSAAIAATLAMALAQVPMLPIIIGIGLIVAAVAAVIYWWDDLKAAFSNMDFFKKLGATIDWVVEKINLIPGIDIGSDSSVSMPEVSSPIAMDDIEVGAKTAPIGNYLNSGVGGIEPQESFAAQVAKSSKGNSGKQVHMGDVYITTTASSLSLADLDERSELDVG